MMSADNRFSGLGCRKEEICNRIRFEGKGIDIWFNKETKTYWSKFAIDKRVNEIINQKLRELGWMGE